MLGSLSRVFFRAEVAFLRLFAGDFALLMVLAKMGLSALVF